MNFSLLILMAVTAGVFVQGFTRKAGFLRYPFLAASVTAGWFIPQAMGLASDLTLPEGAYDLTMLYATACLLATVVGEKIAREPKVSASFNYNGRRLIVRQFSNAWPN